MIETVPAGAQVHVDGQPRGPSPITLSLAPGARFEVVATSNGFLDGAATGFAEREGQTVSLTLDPKSVVDAGSPTTAMPTAGSKPKQTPRTKPAASNGSSKPGFDPNEVGGD
ncbi:MAG: PEGA domain-containing protein [Deltaproteobacteria bacterium]|nr:PEGA domain-containing protein [Deltaproteobacteria bacterium]